MEKQRSLPIDYGIEAGRQCVWSGGSTTNTTVAPDCKEYKYMLDRFQLDQANAISPYSLSSSGLDGYQNFESSERKRPRYNDCRNVKLEGYAYPYSYTAEDRRRPNTVNVVGYAYKPPVDAVGSLNYVLSGEANGTSMWSLAESARSRAWWNMQPRFEGRVSLLNSLFELKDFRDIGKHVMRINFRALGDEAKNLRGMVRRAEKNLGLVDSKVGDIPRLILNGLDSSTRGLAALHLTNELAIKPTMRDAIAICAQAQKTAALEQEAFQKAGGAQQRAHASETLFKDTQVKVLSTYEYMYEYLWKQHARFTASMMYLYSYRKLPSTAAMRKYWGLDFNAEVVWNMLPLSFVLDYIVGIADSLHAMNKDPNVDLQLMQYCESILYEREAGWFTRKDQRTCWLGVNGVFTHHGAMGVPMTGYRYSFYERRVVAPDRGPALPKVSLPSTAQARNLLALARCWI